MRMCSIASGSSGNSIYVGTKETHLLVDCGISGKRIGNGLIACDVEPEKLDGILITHEHIDHVSGLGVMIRRYKKPVYATDGTIAAVQRMKSLGDLSGAEFVPVKPEEPFKINDIEITPVSTWHDAAEPVAYRFNHQGKSVGILTDSGKYDQMIVDNMQGLDAVLIEANHDVRMLQAGSYPYYLKQRILGDRGHLSNELSGRLLNELLSEKMQYVVLGHLSQENNYPDLAYETVRQEVDMADHSYRTSDFKLLVAKRDTLSEMIQI